MERLTVACVLRSGGIYTPLWVEKLKRSVERWIPEAQFVCLDDWLLPERWPGWWSKLELFRPGQFRGRVLYFDLDTLLMGRPEKLLAFDGSFGMLVDWWPPYLANSGVMSWVPGPHTDALWDEAIRADFDKWKGDGDFIRWHMSHETLPMSDITSFKLHDFQPHYPVICGHGLPRFSSARAGWAHHLWMEL